jgi:hypothetical protein
MRSGAARGSSGKPEALPRSEDPGQGLESENRVEEDRKGRPVLRGPQRKTRRGLDSSIVSHHVRKARPKRDDGASIGGMKRDRFHGHPLRGTDDLGAGIVIDGYARGRMLVPVMALRLMRRRQGRAAAGIGRADGAHPDQDGRQSRDRSRGGAGLDCSLHRSHRAHVPRVPSQAEGRQPLPFRVLRAGAGFEWTRALAWPSRPRMAVRPVSSYWGMEGNRIGVGTIAAAPGTLERSHRT